MENLEKIINKLAIPILLSLGEAFCASYVIYQLFGLDVFIIVSIAFLLLSILFTGPVFASAKKTYLALKLKTKNKKLLFALAIGLSFSILYGVFIFRNNALYLAGLLLNWNISIYIIYLLLFFTIPAIAISSLMLWIDLFKFFSEISFNKINTKKLIFFSLTLLGAHITSKVFVSMLLRGSAGFAQLFIISFTDNTIITSLTPLISNILYILILFMMIQYFYSFKKVIEEKFLDKQLEDLEWKDILIALLVIIQSWATGIGMKLLSSASSSFIGGTSEGVQLIVDANDYYKSEEEFDLFANLDKQDLLLFLFVTCSILVSFWIPLIWILLVDLFISFSFAIYKSFKIKALVTFNAKTGVNPIISSDHQIPITHTSVDPDLTHRQNNYS